VKQQQTTTDRSNDSNQSSQLEWSEKRKFAFYSVSAPIFIVLFSFFEVVCCSLSLLLPAEAVQRLYVTVSF
jgi:hypothetical protein